MMSTLATETMAMGTLHDWRADGRSGAWRLPADATCASIARSHVRQMLVALGLPGDLIHAVATVASEFAANAFAHARDAQPRHAASPELPELWIHLVEHPEPHLVISVFDADRHHEPVMRPPAMLEESGRGLRIVAALSAQWGCHLTRSRRGP